MYSVNKKTDTGPGNNAVPAAIQTKLAIGTVNDPLETEADAMADTVMRMPAAISSSPPDGNIISGKASDTTIRKCAKCDSDTDKEEKARMKPLASSITPFIQTKSNGEGIASDALSSRISNSRGNGSQMDGETKTFMESRFGTDFSGVKIHTGNESVQMNRELNAKAFTVGNDIYFNEGQYNTGSESGKHLLAHELTHTVQQGAGIPKAIHRKLSVTNPLGVIPNPTGKGVVQTNRDTVFNYLKSICSAGNVAITAGGEVSVPSYFCSSASYPPDFVGPIPIRVATSGTPVGCGCLCDIISSPNDWRITVDDSSWPHTVFDNNTNAVTSGSGGSGGEVTTPSPNSPLLWGAVIATGAFKDIDPWLVLGHELCGHGWLGNTGDAGRDEVQPRGRGGHQETVARENLLRDEHGIDRRGTHRQPFCGESFSHATGTVATAKSVTMSSYLSVCEKWRKEYNTLNSTSYKISDLIPVTAGEVLPP